MSPFEGRIERDTQLSRGNEKRFGEILFAFAQDSTVCRKSGGQIRALCHRIVGLGYHIKEAARRDEAIRSRLLGVRKLRQAASAIRILLSTHVGEEYKALIWLFGNGDAIEGNPYPF